MSVGYYSEVDLMEMRQEQPMKDTMNKSQQHEGRMRDEGSDGKHMRGDGGVPIVGDKAACLHGAHTGEMHDGQMPTQHAGKGHMYSGLDSGMDKHKKGRDDSEK